MTLVTDIMNRNLWLEIFGFVWLRLTGCLNDDYGWTWLVFM